jgi:hypothetical protein
MAVGWRSAAIGIRRYELPVGSVGMELIGRNLGKKAE